LFSNTSIFNKLFSTYFADLKSARTVDNLGNEVKYSDGCDPFWLYAWLKEVPRRFRARAMFKGDAKGSLLYGNVVVHLNVRLISTGALIIKAN
jgi:hypothetical protein